MTTWSLLFTWNFLLGVSTLADVKWMVMPTFLVPRRSKAMQNSELFVIILSIFSDHGLGISAYFKFC